VLLRLPLDHQSSDLPPETLCDPVSQLLLIDPPSGDALDDGNGLVAQQEVDEVEVAPPQLLRQSLEDALVVLDRLAQPCTELGVLPTFR
jgi:hypothetical protein